MTEVARLSVSITADSKGLQTGLRDAEHSVQSADSRISRSSGRMSAALKGGMAAAGVAAVEFGRRALNSAIQFESSMANVRAVTGATEAEIAALNKQVLAIGAGSVPGVQATAAAFFDISSAVADAGARMELLEHSVRLAEAGQADLATSSAATIKAFNAYRMGISDIEGITDVYTRAVQTGVGTLDQFSASIGSNAALAAGAKVSFEELAAATSLITAKGQTTGAAGTQVKAIISSLLKPTAELEEAYRNLGITNITTAIETEGFIQTLQALTMEAGGSQDKLAAMFGSVEALQGIMVLGADDADEFFNTFNSGVDGATSNARAAQLDTFSAQWSMLKSNIEGAAVAAVDAGGILGGVTDALSGVNMVADFIAGGGAAVPEATTAADLGITATISYTTAEGDTVESVAAALRISTDEARQMLEEADALEVRAGVRSLDLDSLEAATGADLDATLAAMGIEVTIPATVSDEQVTAYLREHGHLTAAEARTILQSQLDAEFAGGMTVSGNIDASALATAISEQTGIAYDDALAAVNARISSRPGSIEVKPGIDLEAWNADMALTAAFMNNQLSRLAAIQQNKYDEMIGQANAYAQLLAGVLSLAGVDISPRQLDEYANEVQGVIESIVDVRDPTTWMPSNAFLNTAMRGLLSGTDNSFGPSQTSRDEFFSLMNFSDAGAAQFGTLRGNPAEGLAPAPGFGQGFNPNFYGGMPSVGGGASVPVHPDAESMAAFDEALDEMVQEPRELNVDVSQPNEAVQGWAGALALVTNKPHPISMPLHVYLAQGSSGDPQALESGAALASSLEGSYATGTNYVPATGAYMLHKGEAVIPADENRRGGQPQTIVTQIMLTLDGRVVAESVNEHNRDASR